MALIELSQPWDRQPQEIVRVNLSHPLASGLRAVIVATDGGFYEAISGQFAKNNATTPVVRAAGRLRRLSGSAISAQFDTTFGMPQNNCAIMVVGQITTSIGFDHGALIKVGDASSGYGIGTGDTTFDAGGSNNNLLCLYEAVAWKAPSPAVVLAAAGQSYAACLRINSDNTGNIYSPGVGEGSWSASTPVTPAGGVTYVGGYTTNRYPPEEEMLIAFLWARTPTNAEVDSLWRNPNQLFAPRSIWVPVSAGGGATAAITPADGVSTTSSIAGASTAAAAITAAAGASTASSLAGKATAAATTTQAAGVATASTLAGKSTAAAVITAAAGSAAASSLAGSSAAVAAFTAAAGAATAGTLAGVAGTGSSITSAAGAATASALAGASTATTAIAAAAGVATPSTLAASSTAVAAFTAAAGAATAATLSSDAPVTAASIVAAAGGASPQIIVGAAFAAAAIGAAAGHATAATLLSATDDVPLDAPIFNRTAGVQSRRVGFGSVGVTSRRIGNSNPN